MNYFMNQFFFGLYPYIAFVTFVVGSLIRYDREQYSWHASSSLLLSPSRSFKMGSNLFHWGIILLLTGHFVGLLTPHAIYSAYISPATKQLLAMVAGGIFGSVCFVGITILTYRRLFNVRVRATSRPSDIIILLLLFAQLILGLMSISVSAQHPDGSEMLSLAEWVQHIVTFRPNAASYVMDASVIFKLHIVLGLTILLMFPFTRLVHIMSVPVAYFWRTGYQIVRSRSAR